MDQSRRASFAAAVGFRRGWHGGIVSGVFHRQDHMFTVHFGQLLLLLLEVLLVGRWGQGHVRARRGRRGEGLLVLVDGLVGGFVGGCAVRLGGRGRRGRVVVVVHQRGRARAVRGLVVVEDLRQAGALLDAVCTGIEVKLLDLLQRLVVVV